MRMLDAGMGVHRVQEIMGHAHLETTERYIRPAPDELIDAQRTGRSTSTGDADGCPYDPADLAALFGPAGDHRCCHHGTGGCGHKCRRR
jgi:hypothetical protein